MAMPITLALTEELDRYTPCIFEKDNLVQEENYRRLHYLVENILITCCEYFTTEQQLKALEALRFAAEKHQGVRRKDEVTPYLLHLLETVYVLLLLKVFDYKCIISAIIHDVVEDTETKIKEIKYRFGSTIGDIVNLLTKHPNFIRKHAYWFFMRNAVNEHVRWRVIVVKFADRIHNLMTLDKVSPERQAAKIEETLREFPALNQVLIKTLKKLTSKGTLKKEYYLHLPFHLNNRLAYELGRYQ